MTIDLPGGGQVSSITLPDGSDVSKVRDPDGNVVFSVIPDSGDLQARYDATELSLSDGDSVSTWADESGNGFDLTAGTAPTFRSSGINGLASVEFNGSSHYLNVEFPSVLTQPYTIFAVIEMLDNDTGDFEILLEGFSSVGPRISQGDNSNDLLNAGSKLAVGPTEQGSTRLSALANGSSSAIRRSDGNSNSGDAGTNDLDGITVGTRYVQSDYWDGYLGELLVYNTDKSNKFAEIEDYLLNKWGPFDV